MKHVVQAGETLGRIAAQYGTTVGALVAANPQIENPDLIGIGVPLTIPTAVVSEPEAPTPAPTGHALTYTVASGDTLKKIAARHGITLTELIAANPQIENPDLIGRGVTLTIPTAVVSEPEVPTPESPPASAPARTEQAMTYTVASGDTMKKIAARHGTTLTAMIAANPQVSDPNALNKGQELNIPDGTTVVSGAKAKPAPPPMLQPADESGHWAAVPKAKRMLYVTERLVAYGYPLRGAAGIVGNLFYESGVLPNRIEGSSPETPMRAKDFDGVVADFSPEDVMHRDAASKRGPQKPGIGLAQWTSKARRQRLFEHEYEGRVLGPEILTNMDAQIDYLVKELRTRYRRVEDVVSAPKVRLKDAADEVLYNFETPASVIGMSGKLPRTEPAVQEVFSIRRKHARRAYKLYVRAHPPDE